MKMILLQDFELL